MKLRKGFIFALSASIVWAIAIVLYRIVLKAGENPYNLTFWTTMLALPYWLFLAFREHKSFRALRRTDYILLTAMALVSSVGVGLAEVFALSYSPAINFSFLIRTVTLFTIIFASVFLKEKITKEKLILVILLLVGSFFLTTGGKTLHFTRGDMFTIIEAILIAFGTNVLGKLATNRIPANTVSSGRFLISVFPLVLLALANTSIALPQHIGLVLVITLLDFLLAIFIFQGFKHATATFMTMIMSFTPVFVSLIAFSVLGESMSVIQIIGGGCIVLSGILVEKLKI